MVLILLVEKPDWELKPVTSTGVARRIGG